ncbi:hypothetical protein D3C74_349010 [compost metagenome]
MVVTPSAAVTTIVIGLDPTTSDAVVAVPLTTAAPFTVTVDPASANVGVTSIEVTLLSTLAV